MFSLIEIEDVVAIPPRDFGKPLKQVALERLREAYEGKIIEELGYVLSSLPLRLGLRLAYFAYLEKWVLLGTLMGIAGGLSAIAFTNLLRIFESLFHGIYHGVLDGNRLLFPLIPALGGLISGLLVYTFAPEAEGHGTDSVIDAIHRRWCRIRWRVPLIKSLASAVTISSGGSAGKEGPIAQIAAGVGAVLSDVLHLHLRDKRVILISGLAAGIGSIFKSPLGASIFAVEVMYKRDFEIEALIPAILSSIIGYTIYCLYDGWEPVLSHPEYVYKNPVELVFFLVTGVVAGLVAVAYVKVFYGMRDAFALLRIPNHVKPAFALALHGGFLTRLSRPLGALVIFLRAWRPTQTAHLPLSSRRSE